MMHRLTALFVITALGLGLSGCDKPEDNATAKDSTPAAPAPVPVTQAKAEPDALPRSERVSGDYIAFEDGSAILRRCDNGVELDVTPGNQTLLLNSSLERLEETYSMPVTLEGYTTNEGESLVITDILDIGTANDCGEPNAGLTNTYWKFLSTSELAEIPGDLEGEPHITLAADGTFKGHGGCNSMFGKYLLDGDMLSFEATAATRMACPDIAAVDSAFHNALKQTGSYRIDGNTLFLETTNGTTLATLEAVAITH